MRKLFMVVLLLVLTACVVPTPSAASDGPIVILETDDGVKNATDSS